MHPPGLFPEASGPGRSKASWVLAAVVFTALAALAAALLQIRRLGRERDDALESLAQLRRRPVEAVPRPLEDPHPAAQTPVPPAPAPASAPPDPARPDGVRPPAPPRPDPQHLAQGLQDFRAGRYDQAERHFFRALPESFLYLALTCLARGDDREAIGFLTAAMRQDPNWLRKLRPGDLFGSPSAYEAVLKALEERLSKDPASADLKTLLAYLRFHDQGAPYAKALLIEATNADPDHHAARTFLEALGP